MDFTKHSLHKLETINCAYTNADCLTNKVSELGLLIRNHKPTIVGLQDYLKAYYEMDSSAIVKKVQALLE
jgi:hypothetical protein